MRKIYFSFFISLFLCTGSFAQTVVVAGADATTLAGNPYTTLEAAFDNINLVSQAGNVIVITITGTTTETSPAILFQSVGPWTSMSIIPAGVAAVTGNVANLIDLRGADNVTIDGLNAGGNSLTFTNYSVSLGSTFVFSADASNNIITRCTILGSSTAFGTIFFGDGTITGNDNNSITQCDISAAAGGLPLYAILSLGLSTAVDNSNNTIAMNTISDYYYDLDYSAGIILGANSSAWTINNNKIYQTASRTYTSAFTHYGIRIIGGDAYNIENNIIGFANAAGAGTTNMTGLSSGSLGGVFPSSFTAGGTAVQLRYTAINCAFKTGGVVSSIQNNTIGGIALYTSSAATVTNGMLCGIAVTSGNADIGTIAGNTIGSASGTSSIYVASISAGGVIAGIYCTSSNTINIQNNTIGGIDASGTTVAQATGFKGIDIAGTGSFTVSNNQVGNATANNIRTGYLLTGANLSNTATTPTAASGGGVIRAIVNSVTGATVDISNNIIRGIQISGNASSFTGISSTGTISTTMNINGNEVGNAVTNAVVFPFATGATIFGISVIANTTGTTNVNNNLIYGITCPAANSVTGIITSAGVATATLNINNNSFINNVISGTAVSTPMVGINNSAIVSILNITGNIMRSNSSTATTGGFTGIQNTAAVANTVNINNNQLGNASGGAVTFSAATISNINGITNTNAANAATVNINNNSLDGFSVVNTGQVFFIQNTAGNAVTTNINNNQLGTVTGTLISFSGVQTSSLRGIYNPSGSAGTVTVSIQNNDIRGIVQTATGTASQTYIDCQAPLLSSNISNNTFTNLSINSSGQVILILKGGAMNSIGTSVISNNSIVGSFSKTAAGNNVIMYLSAPASASGSTLTISGNNFSNITTTGATVFYGIEDFDGLSAASAPTKTISGNTISNVTMGTGNFSGLFIDKGENLSIASNTISNVSTAGDIIAIYHLTNAGTGTLDVSSNSISALNSTGEDIYAIAGGSSGPATINVHDNNISGLSSGGSNKMVIGIYNSNGQTTNIYDNSVNNLTATGIGSPEVNGIWLGNGTTANIYRNKIHTLEQTSSSAIAVTAVNGILIHDGTTVNVYNNFVANLHVSNASFADAIRGISVTSTTAATTYNLYYNSIYFNASSSGTNFGTSGIYHVTNLSPTTARLNMINNIVVNTSTANGTGVTAAYRRSGTTLDNYGATSDYNLFYAGTPSATKLIFYDGTNSDQTLAAYQTRVSTRDANSISLMPAFTSATNLHLSPGSNCQINGRGTPVPGITTDIDVQPRNATIPDIGADEFIGGFPLEPEPAHVSTCENRTVSATGTTYITQSCSLIARVVPSGADPVSGRVSACVTLDATQQYFNGEPYVQRHFDIEPITGNQTTTSATVTLYFQDSEFELYNANNPAWPKLPTDLGGGMTDPNKANLKITQFHGAASTSPSSPGNYPGSRVLIDPVDTDIEYVMLGTGYWAVTFPVTGFSGFYVHTNNFNAPLPVIVNYLTGRKQGSDNLLNWKVTCTSPPRATMTLDRSSDARNYSGIYNITADAARCQQPFDHTDADPLKGMNYYRLKIVDADGKITYSTTVALLNAVKGFDIVSIAPNPVVSNNFKLNVASAQSGKMEVLIFDVQGRLVNKQTLSLIAGFNSIPVNVANLSPGTYTIKGSMADDRSKVMRFVKR